MDKTTAERLVLEIWSMGTKSNLPHEPSFDVAKQANPIKEVIDRLAIETVDNMKVSRTKIFSILQALDGAEYIYLKHLIHIRDNLNTMMKKYNLSKKDICQRLKIKPSKYNDFIKGAYDYKLKDMALINSLFCELELDRIEERAPIQVNK